MNVELYSLHWDNFNPKILDFHKKIMRKFNIPLRYENRNISHGLWLNQIFATSKADVVGIIEPDLILLNENAVSDAIHWVDHHQSFLGHAQVSNHIPPCTHIFASPAFFFMKMACYHQMGRPSFQAYKHGDVAETVSYRAEKLGIRFKTLRPTYFERPSLDGVWPLGSMGYYGVGTVFENQIYHLFQGRTAENIDLFTKRCQQVLDNTFSTSDFIPSQAKAFEFPITPYPYNRLRWDRRWLRALSKMRHV